MNRDFEMSQLGLNPVPADSGQAAFNGSLGSQPWQDLPGLADRPVLEEAMTEPVDVTALRQEAAPDGVQPPAPMSGLVALRSRSMATLRSPIGKVTCLALGAMALTALLIVRMANFGAPHHGPSKLTIPALALAPAFAFTLAYAVHFQLRRESRSVSLSQIPLVVGLFFTPPVPLILAFALSPIPYFLFVSKLPRIKLLINVTGLFLDATLACTVFHLLYRDAAGLPIGGWQVTVAAVFAGEIGSLTLVAVAIYLFEARFSIAEVTRPLAFVLAVAFANTALALVAVAALSYEPLTVLPIIAIVSASIAGIRAYVSLREKHEGLGNVYKLQGEIPLIGEANDELFPVLERTREILFAEQLELVISAAAAGGTGHKLVVRADGYRDELLITEDEESGYLASHSGLQARSGDVSRMLVPVSVGGSVVGSLCAVDREGDLRSFNGDDLRLLETLATQVGIALDKASLLEQLQVASTHDQLTGLLTLHELCKAIDETLLANLPLLVMLVDVLRIQEINEAHGHDFGEEVLRSVAARLREALPGDAMAARSGGGEFAVMIPMLDSELGSVELATDVITSLGRLAEVMGVTVDVRVCAGYGLSTRDGHDTATLLRRAESALAAARRHGSLLLGYDSEFDRASSRRLRLIQDLRGAIDTGQLAVAFQPLIRAADAVCLGAEALVRWEHPEFGQLSPDEFIPLAEQNDLIAGLTEIVLGKSLAQARVWADDGLDLRVAVNLSARMLHDIGLPSQIFQALRSHGVSPARLTLEITESSVAEDPVRALAVLERLHAIGVRLSVDDFGTGYSNLAHLKRFPVDEVKMDRQFLEGMGTVGDEALVESVIRLGHSMELEIVAEGVEDDYTARRLVELGVDVLQGYHYGRPMAAEWWPGWMAGRVRQASLE